MASRSSRVAGRIWNVPTHAIVFGKTEQAPIAQLDRASASGAEGRWFESSWAHQPPQSVCAARERIDPQGHVVEELFKTIPKGTQLYRKALKAVMTPLINDFNQAVKQIRDTKTLFNLPDADGVLIILNESVRIAGQPLVYKRLKQRLLKKNGVGVPFHADLNRVLYVGEAYVMPTGGGDQRMAITLPNPHSWGKHDSK